MQVTRVLALALTQYARDHGGKYPDGKSSTEVFQKLIDGQYITDPDIFYLPMSGKTRAPDQASHITSANVGYDITGGMTDQTPGDVPAVFVTGYLIEYKAGGHAIPLIDRPRPGFWKDGIAISYHNNNAYFRRAQESTGVVTNAVPADTELGPGPYTQLTPDGPVTGN